MFRSAPSGYSIAAPPSLSAKVKRGGWKAHKDGSRDKKTRSIYDGLMGALALMPLLLLYIGLSHFEQAPAHHANDHQYHKTANFRGAQEGSGRPSYVAPMSRPGLHGMPAVADGASGGLHMPSFSNLHFGGDSASPSQANVNEDVISPQASEFLASLFLLQSSGPPSDNMVRGRRPGPNVIIIDSWAETPNSRQGHSVENFLSTLGWTSISKYVKALTSDFMSSSGFDDELSGIAEATGQIAQPAHILRHIQHHQFPLMQVANIVAQAEAAGPWVLFDPSAAFVLNYLQMVPGFEAVLIYVTDTDIQATMAAQQWDLHHMARLSALRFWSDWQYSRYRSLKYKFSYSQLKKARSKLGGGSSSSYSSYSSSSYSQKSYGSSSYSYKGSSGNTISHPVYKGRNFTAVFKGGKPAEPVLDMQCPAKLVDGTIAGIDKVKSQGHECALRCSDSNCTNVLEACYAAPGCTHIIFNDLYFSSASTLFGGVKRKPRIDYSSGDGRSSSYSKKNYTSSYTSSKTRYSKYYSSSGSKYSSSSGSSSSSSGGSGRRLLESSEAATSDASDAAASETTSGAVPHSYNSWKSNAKSHSSHSYNRYHSKYANTNYSSGYSSLRSKVKHKYNSSSPSKSSWGSWSGSGSGSGSLYSKYSSGSTYSGMTNSLARLKHALTPDEISNNKKVAEAERQASLSECLSKGAEALALNDDSTDHGHELQQLAYEKAEVEARVRNRTAPVMFVHIHKAGGTTLCNLAKENNLTVPAVYSPTGYAGIGGKNCNPSPNHLKVAWTGSAQEQMAYAHMMGLDFYAHEKFLPPELPFGEVAFLAILRNPFDRLLSEGKHTGFKCLAELPPKPSAMEEVGQKAASLVDSAKSWFYNSSQTAEKGPAAAETKGAGESTSTSSASSRAYSSGGATQKYMKDANGNIVKKPKVEGATTFAEYVKCGESNVMVKRICGCLDYPKAQSCGDYSEGSVIDAHFRHHPMTRAHLECAKKRLDHFSVVLVTEMMEEAAPFLRWKFGWESVDTHAARGGTSRGSSALEEFKNEPETIQMLHDKHDLDLELYEHAVSLLCQDLAKMKELGMQLR